MTNFFTGCTHFGHANIIRLADRPFETVEHMNTELIRRWNEKVRPEDTVYHLGDVAWGSQVENFFLELNGSIIFITGNHDDPDEMENLERDYPDNTFVTNYHELKIDSQRLVLFHYPIDDWNGRWRGAIHLHCHTHSKTLRNPHLPYVNSSDLEFGEKTELGRNYPVDLTCNRFCVGVDSTDFAPISFEEIMKEARA